MSGDGGTNLYKRGKTWWARVQVQRREIRRSLRTGSKVEARKRLEKLLSEARSLRYGDRRHEWKEAVTAWQREAIGAFRPKTIQRYLCSLAKVRGFLDELHVDEITAGVIAKLARRAGVTNATRRRDITAVSAVLRWCVAQGWRQDNPARIWDRSTIRERRDPIRLPTEYDIACAVGAAPRSMAPLIRFAQYTGMRQEECASLEWGQIDMRRRAATLLRTKTGRARAVPLDERAVGTLAGTVQRLGCPYVFWHDAGVRYHNLATQFGAVMRRSLALARKDRRPPPRRFRFHDLRHWYAVDYLKRGGSIYRLQQVLGHSSIATTEGYLDFLTPEEQEIAKSAPAQNPDQR